MAFVGVEFANEDSANNNTEVAIVNVRWFTPNETNVFWPPVKSQDRYEKLLKQGATPTNEWLLCQVTKTYFETDDFKKAEQKVKLCQYLSDVATDVEPVLDIPSKRQRNKPSRYISDSSDEENTPVPSKLKAPPRLNNIFTSCSQVPSDKILVNSIHPKTNNKPTTSHFVQPSHKHSVIQRNSVPVINSINEVPLTDVNRNLTDINATLAFIKRQNTDIYNQNDQMFQVLKATNNSIVTVSKSNEIPQLPCTLPITTFEDITRLEEYLKKEENISPLASYLSTIGDRGDVTSITNRILRRLLSDKIASFYSFLGKRNKKAFAHLKLNSVLMKSVLLALPGSTQHEIENSVKEWSTTLFP
ncbi:uncharacterized protein LOC112590429 isoform X1 [Harpegnathos saltator]|uniref:uncharacterized protein LOC112590429 isoform X1 n=1 Tax=Harpegnathos saltator TaxID=610380 RepID=UPI000DBEE21F|nr:uncharacterized protein LOC112590429 isoform X1 [Harpegnathos saltator]XP_025162614.1 uncharacterized protein LOC112590429 isoform X1 [Harpegnathos saltator]